MSSWSLVLWRPPPSYRSPAREDPVYTVNPHVAALLDQDCPPCPDPMAMVALTPRPEERGSVVGEDFTHSDTTPDLEPMDIDVDSGTAGEPADAMAVDECEPSSDAPACEQAADPDPLPSGEDSPRARHQGMHKRPATDTIDAARVLRRPFKSPARVVLRGAKRKADSPPACHSSSSSAPDTEPEWPHKLPPRTSSRPPSSPRSTSSGARRSDRTARAVTAKFKPPGPSSDSEASRSSRRRRGPDADLIASLEARVRVLKQAAACADDDRVVALIAQWRAAGREVTERLFRMIPEPEPEPRTLRSKSWGWGWDETPFAESLPDSCTAYIRDECGVRDGEIVDPNGVPLFEDEAGIDDVLPKTTAAGKGRPPRIPPHDGCAQVLPEQQPWNRGTMLNRLGVDPALLGFNVEEDDWDDINDD